jgi:hypothetical protein
VQISRTAIATLVLMAFAVALHAYEQLGKSTDPSPIWFLWSMFPYSVSLLVLLSSKSAIPALFGTGAMLTMDARAYYTVFVAPKSSTAALELIVIPLINAFVIAPIVIFVVWLIVRLIARHTRVAESG